MGDFKSTVYKQILKLSVELDDKYVKLEEFKNGEKATAKKIDGVNSKIKKIGSDYDDKNKELELKIDERCTIKEFKN